MPIRSPGHTGISDLVYSDESWGVHDPVGTNTLLDEAASYAAASNASLGHALVSTVNLTAGWNLKALENASCGYIAGLDNVIGGEQYNRSLGL